MHDEGGGGPDQEPGPAGKPRARRQRRGRDDLVRRIRDAARELFGERGYASATTKEIARRADVSETLLFRYFNDKAGLFADVVTAPFHRLIDAFVSADHGNDPESDVAARARRLIGDVFRLFEENETLFRALLVGSLVHGPEGDSPEMAELLPFFEKAVAQVQARYDRAGQTPPIDLDVSVRLGFGMIVSSVLLRDTLFPAPPAREAVLAALEYIVERSLIGPQRD